MSLIPEHILQTTITRGIRTLKEDSKLVSQLFRNLSQGNLNNIIKFLESKTISLFLNYPKEPPQVPAILLILKNENESAAYLGDSMGYVIPDEFGYDGGMEDELLGGVASVEDLHLPKKTVFGPWRVKTSTNNTLKINSEEWVVNDFADGKHTVHIVKGTGIGQIRDISTNSDDTLMISSVWGTTPDNTSVFEIRQESNEEILGEPSKLYNRRDSSLFTERLGSLYTNRYQVQIVTAIPAETVYLYTILKSILTISRKFLEGQGVINLKMSGTDLLTRAEYLPDHAYVRTLNLDFDSPFDIYKEAEDVVHKLELSICEGNTGEEIVSATQSGGVTTLETYGVGGSAVFYVDGTTDNNAGSGDLTFTVPDLTAEGDLLVAGIYHKKGSTTSISTPNGWRSRGNPLEVQNADSSWSHLEIFTKIVEDVDPSSHTFDGGSGDALGIMSVYRGNKTSSPINDVSNYVVDTGTSISAGPVEVVPGGVLVSFYAGVADGGSGVGPNGFSSSASIKEREEEIYSDAEAITMFDEFNSEDFEINSGTRSASFPVAGRLLSGMISINPL